MVVRPKIVVKATIELTIEIDAKTIVEQWWGEDWADVAHGEIEIYGGEWGPEIEDDLRRSLPPPPSPTP